MTRAATTRTWSRPVKKDSGELNEGSRLEISPRLSFTLASVSGSQDNSLDESFGASRERGITPAHESGCGTKRTSRLGLTMSVHRGWSQPVDATLYLKGEMECA